MKVTVRLIGDGIARADALVADVRRRALERLQARIDARGGTTRTTPTEGLGVSAPTTTPPTR